MPRLSDWTYTTTTADWADSASFSIQEQINQAQNNLLKSYKKPMKKISNMMKKLLDSDIQDLVKAGFINGDLELTSEGKQALMELMFDTQRAALVEVAKVKIAEEREE